MDNMLMAVDQDIKDSEYMINDIEKKITDQKMKQRKGKNDHRRSSLRESNGLLASIPIAGMPIYDRRESISTTNLTYSNDKVQNGAQRRDSLSSRGSIRNGSCEDSTCRFEGKTYETNLKVKPPPFKGNAKDQDLTQQEKGVCQVCKIF